MRKDRVRKFKHIRNHENPGNLSVVFNISTSNFTDSYLIELGLLAQKQTDCVSHHRDPKRDRTCSDMI